MFKKYTIIALGALIISLQANGMTNLRAWAKPAAISAAMLYASYQSKPISCSSCPSWLYKTATEEETLTWKTYMPELASIKGSSDIRRPITKQVPETIDRFTKIVPGVTPGFDHVKFAALKKKYLDGVSSEIKDFDAENPPLGTARTYQAVAQAAADEGFFPTYLCDPSIETKTCELARCQLRKCGVNPNDVSIIRHPTPDKISGTTLMGTMSFSDSPKKLLFINTNRFNPENLIQPTLVKISLSDKKKAILVKQFFDHTLRHEASHMLHSDHSKVEPTRLALNEKQANIFGVFNCSNPLGTARLLKNSASQFGLYGHVSTPEWRTMIAEIESCYSPELLASSSKKIDGYKVTTIEHVDETN